MMRIEVLGVHPVEAPEPCHMVRVVVVEGEPDFAEVTQPLFNRRSSDWQVAWDERQVGVDGEGRPVYVFFFHYLDTSRALYTREGPAPLPEVTPVPPELRSIRYEAPG